MATHKLPAHPDGLGAMTSRYEALLCDVWGVVHDGLAPYAPAVNALQRFRAQGGSVLLLSNSPRLSADIPAQLAQIGVAADCYDDIITSGDATLFLLERDHKNKTYCRIAPDRDAGFFSALTLAETDITTADLVVCSGLVDDESETPADYADFLKRALSRQLPFICVNPDIIVHKGNKQLYCAGALARLYEEQGGVATYAGKPHRPIYDLAFTRLADIRGLGIDRDNVLAIGDGLGTDVLGAAAAGINALFITGGIHEDELHDSGKNEDELLAAFLARAGIEPQAVMHHLFW